MRGCPYCLGSDPLGGPLGKIFSDTFYGFSFFLYTHPSKFLRLANKKCDHDVATLQLITLSSIIFLNVSIADPGQRSPDTNPTPGRQCGAHRRGSYAVPAQCYPDTLDWPPCAFVPMTSIIPVGPTLA